MSGAVGARRGGRFALFAWGASLVASGCVGLAGCARPGPPPGGPADSTPPEITRTLPADGDTWVDRSTVIEVEFSEEMDRQSVERAFTLAPEVALRNLRWTGKTLLAEPVEALPDSTTFVAAVAEAAKDYHGVRMSEAYSFAFATGGLISTGLLAGTVSVLGEPIGGATVWACQGDVVADSAGVVAPCDYETRTSDDGSFVLSNVRSSDLSYSLVAFVDRNENERYETGAETGWVVPAAARIAAPGDSIGGLSVQMRAPAEESMGPRGQQRE